MGTADEQVLPRRNGYPCLRLINYSRQLNPVSLGI